MTIGNESQIIEDESIELDELDRDNIFWWLGDILGKLKEENATLYLIVYKDIMDRILSGDKRIEYRECTDYWKKRIVDIPYTRVRITNGYGNDTRPYVLLKYKGYEEVEYNGKPHYAIPIDKKLWLEFRKEVNGVIEKW